MSTPPAKSPTGDSGAVWIAVGGFVVLIFLLGQCSSGDADTDLSPVNMVDTNMSTAIAAQAPPAPEPLNAASLQRGGAHLRLAHSAEGFSGAMIYSQNCYDALGRDFSWQRLDICGAFDALASRAMNEADTIDLATEEVYFQSEAVAGRYLAAATGAGEEAGNADQRLTSLQSQMAEQRVPRITAVPSSLDNILDGTTDDTNSFGGSNTASDLDYGEGTT